MKKKARRINVAVLRAITIFAVIIAVSLLLETQLTWMTVRKSAERSTTLLLNQIETVLQANEQEEEADRQVLKENYIADAETIAYILSAKPDAIYDVEELKTIAGFQKVDEINIFDAGGTIISGTVPKYYGYSFDSGEQMGYFKPMLEDKTLTMCQDVTPNTAEGKSMMYALAWNQEGTMMIQVGIEPKGLLEDLKDHQISNVIDGIPLTEGFAMYAIDPETREIIAGTDDSKNGSGIPAAFAEMIRSSDSGSGVINHNGSRYFCNYRPIGDYIITVAYNMNNSAESMYSSVMITAAYMVVAGILIMFLFLRLYKAGDEREKHIQQLADYNRIMASAGFGLWHITLKDGVDPRMQVNDKMAELLGITGQKLTEEETYNAWYDRIVPEAIPSVQASVGEMMNGSFSENTYQWDHPVKGIIYVRCGGTAVKLKDGTNLLSGYHADVTEIVAAEQETRQALEKAKEAAEAANKAKTTFLFNMSHDIRTPMNAIVGFTDLIEKHYDDKEKCMDYLHKAQNANRFLLSLINNVLEMARIESGNVSLTDDSCCIDQFNATLYSVFEEQMKKKHIRFTRTVDVRHHYVFCDQVKLREIFLNIISNAFKYTPEGGTVSFDLKELPSDREGYGLYRTVIADTGIGMSEEFLPHIFEEFSRAKSATDSRIEGTGLGMPIVKKYLELMNGTIQVESELGKGSKLTVMLYHKISDEKDLNEGSDVTHDRKMFNGKRILLAEDNDLNAEIAEEILQEAGFKVERAEDGAVCCDMLRTSQPGYYDLILMDIQMPNMNGYDAAKAIRSMNEPAHSSVPIIAMTANAFESDVRDALAAGMNGHVAKPIEIAKLMKALEEVMK